MHKERNKILIQINITTEQHVGFVVDKSALGQVFSEYFGFPCQSLHQFLHHQNTRNLKKGERECGRRVGLTTLSPSISHLCKQCGSLNLSHIYGPPWPVTGILLLFYFNFLYQSFHQILHHHNHPGLAQ
jgi:hypothetical protein